jgi:hypothetical protein
MGKKTVLVLNSQNTSWLEAWEKEKKTTLLTLLPHFMSPSAWVSDQRLIQGFLALHLWLKGGIPQCWVCTATRLCLPCPGYLLHVIWLPIAPRQSPSVSARTVLKRRLTGREPSLAGDPKQVLRLGTCMPRQESQSKLTDHCQNWRGALHSSPVLL